jgi:hypothetical protein
VKTKDSLMRRFVHARGLDQRRYGLCELLPLRLDFGPRVIATRAPTRRFFAILRDIRKSRDWMVDDAVSCGLLSRVNRQPVDT